MVPECYSPLLPPKPEPYFKYQNEGGNGFPGAAQVQTLTELLRKKPTPEEVLELVQQLPNPLKGKCSEFAIYITWKHLIVLWLDDDGDMEPSHNPLAIEVFVQTLLHLGSKSFTHTFAGLAKYHSVFKVCSTYWYFNGSIKWLKLLRFCCRTFAKMKRHRSVCFDRFMSYGNITHNF